jgi:hypothetical protein
MSESTKPKIKWARVVLLNLRICTLLGALGLLFCIICIKPTGISVDWILRVAPGIGVLHGMYGVYHLCRAAKSRTPATSASYMVFAAVMDAGILPFLAFTAFMANSEMMLAANAKGQWQTQFFSKKFQTSTIVYATYLVSIAAGGAHIFAFCISIYLAVLFRRITKLPPDMNPLEDNLTSRHSHKRNKSSISTFITEPAKPSNTPHQPLIEKSAPMHHGDMRGLSSDSPPSPYRRSGPPGARNSPMSFYALPYQPSPAPPHSSQTDLRRSPPRATKRASAPPGSPINGGRSPPRAPPQPRPHSHHPMAPRSSDEENWLIHPSPPSSPVNHSGYAPPELQYLRQGRRSRGSTPDIVATAPRLMPTQPNMPTKFQAENRSPKPLGMNPPTPPVTTKSAASEYARNPYRSPTREQRQALREVTENSKLGANGSPMTWEEVNLRPGKERRVPEVVEGVQGAAGKGKGRFYGSLRGMIGGRKSEDGFEEEKEKGGRRRASDKRERVVSSGVDGAGRRGLRAREVSGKVAEEGRSVVLH